MVGGFQRPFVLTQFAWLVGSLALLIGAHRLAGPMYRFQRVFQDVARGVLTMRVSTRQGDYLSAEAKDLDLMVESLRARIGSAQTELARASREGAQLARRERVVSGVEISALVESIARTQVILDEFETGADASAEERRQNLHSEPERAERSTSATPFRSRGFTLIELIVVLGLISTLAVIAVPAYSAALGVARVTRAMGT